MKAEHVVLQNSLEAVVDELNRIIIDAQENERDVNGVVNNLAAYKDSLHRIAESIK